MGRLLGPDPDRGPPVLLNTKCFDFIFMHSRFLLWLLNCLPIWILYIFTIFNIYCIFWIMMIIVFLYNEVLC